MKWEWYEVKFFLALALMAGMVVLFNMLPVTR